MRVTIQGLDQKTVAPDCEPVVCDWSEFAAANSDGYSADELQALYDRLAAGETVREGGGAATLFEISAARD